ncbi:Ig-specific serine endopeptidase MIP [[Mycoplasma] collis]|uniref:Ig-specific serine endopeptidase MIP n=1 Tax=[Mycoplasma] collis TaxID=2127 RepID=UPI00056207AC|nr:DUF31 family protein [[Mycoplasma] collis]
MKKKLLLLTNLLTITPFSIIACSNNQTNPEPSLPNPNPININPNPITEKINFSFTNDFGQVVDKAELYAGDIKVANVKASSESIQIVNIIYDQDANGNSISNLTGKLTIVYRDKNSNVNKQLEVSDFKKNFINAGSSGVIQSNITDSVSLNSEELKKWKDASLKDRYKLSSPKYLNVLKNQLTANGQVDLKEIRKNTTITDAKKEEFNQKADKLNIDNWDDLYLKGFSVPNYDDAGNFKGLKIKEGSGIVVGPSWVDARNRDNHKLSGLARMLVSEEYKTAALQTLSITISNKDTNDPNTSSQETGTMWILDYEIPKDSSKYPTKWYFATNLHVAKKFNESTSSIFLRWLKPERANLFTKYKIVEQDDSFYRKGFEIKNSTTNEKAVKVVYEAKDYLNANYGEYLETEQKTKILNILKYKKVLNLIISNLNNYLSSQNIENNEDKKQKLIREKIENIDNSLKNWNIANITNDIDELKMKINNFSSSIDVNTDNITVQSEIQESAEFAVIEIDFSKLNTNEVGEGKFAKDFYELAKLVTNDYYNNKDKHIKFLAKTYLEDYSQIQDKIYTNEQNQNYNENHDNLFVVGYPRADEDYFLDQYKDSAQLEKEKASYSLWTNADYRLYEQSQEDENSLSKDAENKKKNSNNNLSYNIGYRSFIDKPGISDLFISVPKNRNFLYEHNDGNSYLASGLNYVIRQYSPFGGASGSSVRNQNNELVGIYHTSANQTAKTGLATAFRSNGYNYDGLFGTYNLPQYDLIYGGGKDQKSSYREALKELYKNSDFKTNLFPNGLDKIDDKFKFNNEKKDKQ